MIAATNRADILDPALLRSGRLDRKIEFPHPTEDARARILQARRGAPHTYVCAWGVTRGVARGAARRSTRAR